MGSELYIGAPNGLVLCVDEILEAGPAGRFYHAYDREPVRFSSLGEMLFLMEDFFDKIGYPRRGNQSRSFSETATLANRPKENVKMMSDQELLGNRGQQETFIIRVQHRQNNTWQGRITWADQNRTLTFRSIWEMVHLMESALYKDVPPEEMPQLRSWDTEEA